MTRKQLELLKTKILTWLKESISSNRFNHIIGVVKTAKKYAQKLKLDLNKTELSALLHDCAKEMTNKQLIRCAKKNKIKIHDVDYLNPHILHARTGEIIARKKFDIKDKDILAGIRCHTLAEPKMSKLAMVIYLADATEPGREKKKIKLIKKILKKDGLKKAVLEAINQKLLEVIKRGKAIHPYTIEARNWLIQHF